MAKPFETAGFKNYYCERPTNEEEDFLVQRI
jgi:hypothetical protein